MKEQELKKAELEQMLVDLKSKLEINERQKQSCSDKLESATPGGDEEPIQVLSAEEI